MNNSCPYENAFGEHTPPFRYENCPEKMFDSRTMKKGTVEADLFLLRMDLSMWIRNFGVDDGDEINPEDAEQMLECFFDDMKPKLFELALREQEELKAKNT